MSPGGGWSRAGWALAVAATCLVQVLLAAWLSRGSAPSRPGRGDPARLLLASPGAARSLPDDHPDLLSRLHPRGFTGSLWEEAIEPPGDYLPWQEPHQYYQGAEALIGGGPGRRAVPATPLRPAPSVVSRPPHRLLDSERPPDIPPRSRMVADGELASFLPGALPPLPAFAHPRRLRPTVVSVAADRFGWPLWTTLLSSSQPRELWPPGGLPEADAFALRWIRELRFGPDEQDRDWPREATLTFHWALREELR